MNGSRFFMLKYNSDKFNFTYFNTPLDSINSIKDFDLYDSYPADPHEIKIVKQYVMFEKAFVEFVPIDPINSVLNFKTVCEETSDFDSIIFNLGMWEYRTKSTPYINFTQTNCKFSKSRYDKNEISFSISKFKAGGDHSIRIDASSSVFNLTNIPATIDKDSSANYKYNITFAVNCVKSIFVIKIVF